MNLITGYFGKPHIKTNQDSMWHRGIWKDDCIIAFGENLNPQIISNNEIQVRSGVINMQGRFSEIPLNTYDSLTINNGTVGENRIDLIVLHYEKNADTQVESTVLKVIQGTPSLDTPSAPSYTEGNIDNGDLIAELPLFKVNIEGINITKVENIIEVQPPVNLARTLLFDGVIQTGQITLNDIIGNYRFLVVRLSNGTTSTDYKYGNTVMPVIETSSNRFDVMVGQTFKYQDNTMATFTGEITTNGLNSNIINITVPFSQVVHKTGVVHSGNTEVYVKEIWGIR